MNVDGGIQGSEPESNPEGRVPGTGDSYAEPLNRSGPGVFEVCLILL